MPPKQEKNAIDVIEIDSSDDEDNAGKASNTSSNEPATIPVVQTATAFSSSVSNLRSLGSQSFWKAGDYTVGPSKSTVTAPGQLEHARVHPKFLHSNATSHKWAFGAIAELLDNAVDEICNGATFVKVDRVFNPKDNSPALLFQDDGGGMNPEGIRKCMSLGYSSKKTNTTIGQYGNGFKTSTMRLGADVIVLSRSSQEPATQSVGLLSYTFLRRTGQDDVIVPMVDFDISNHWAEPLVYSSMDDWSANLKSILEWSPFKSKNELMLQFDDIGPHGTKIIVYNLWLNDEGVFELNFDDDDEDIRLRDEAKRVGLSKVDKRVRALHSHISYRIRYSLRVYASILYLRKFANFKIILRGKEVEQCNISEELKYLEVITYRPNLVATSKEVIVETTIGFIKEAPDLGVSGFNVYHKNRLIRPFWKVTNDGSSRGKGVVGVLEANFIEPAHDKQDFERSSLFSRLEARLKQMVMDYWKSHCQLIGYQAPGHDVRGVEKGRQQCQPIIDLATNPKQGMGASQQENMYQNELSTIQSIVDSEGVSVQKNPFFEGSISTDIDQICDQNIQLFMRCEEYVKKENEMERTIEELEQALEETKRKCVELSLLLESQRKHKVVKKECARV